MPAKHVMQVRVNIAEVWGALLHAVLSEPAHGDGAQLAHQLGRLVLYAVCCFCG